MGTRAPPDRVGQAHRGRVLEPRAGEPAGQGGGPRRPRELWQSWQGASPARQSPRVGPGDNEAQGPLQRVGEKSREGGQREPGPQSPATLLPES